MGIWAALWDVRALLGRRVRNPVVLIQLTTHTHSHWTSDTVASTHWLLTASVIMREAKVNVRVIVLVVTSILQKYNLDAKIPFILKV